MGLFKDMFGKKKALSEADLIMEAEKFLWEAELLISGDFKGAMKSIGKKVYDFGNLLRQEGPLRERFADMVLKGIFLSRAKTGKEAIETSYKNLPSVTTVCVEAMNAVGEIISALQRREKDLVFIEYPTYYGPAGSTPQYALLEIELLYEFFMDPRVLLIYLDEVNFMARRSFLLSALQALVPDTKVKKLTDGLYYFLESQENVEFQDGIMTEYRFEVTGFYTRI